MENLLDGTLTNGISFQIGADTGQTVTVAIAAIAPADLSIGGTSQVNNCKNAMAYIATIDAAISIISTNRGTYAAAINRLDHAIANMQNISTNLSPSKGRIEDADFAAETANLARAQVLQQASMAMLAQANASKQNILTLFQ